MTMIKLHRIDADGKASPLYLPTAKIAFCTVDRDDKTPAAARSWAFWGNHGWMVRESLDQLRAITKAAKPG